MSGQDVEYFRERAEVERQRAKSASRADVAQVHEELASLYDALTNGARPRPILGISVFPRAIRS